MESAARRSVGPSRALKGTRQWQRTERRSVSRARQGSRAGCTSFSGSPSGSLFPSSSPFYASNGYLPMTFGFRSLAGGAFERLAPEAFVAFGVVLVVCSLVSALVGVLLWRGRALGAYLGLAIDPFIFAMGWGFALPLLLIGVPLRAVLTVAALWRFR